MSLKFNNENIDIKKKLKNTIFDSFGSILLWKKEIIRKHKKVEINKGVTELFNSRISDNISLKFFVGRLSPCLPRLSIIFTNHSGEILLLRGIKNKIKVDKNVKRNLNLNFDKKMNNNKNGAKMILVKIPIATSTPIKYDKIFFVLREFE